MFVGIFEVPFNPHLGRGEYYKEIGRIQISLMYSPYKHKTALHFGINKGEGAY
jgi:hypothetical protein